jgi:hypothetical protein
MRVVLCGGSFERQVQAALQTAGTHIQIDFLLRQSFDEKNKKKHKKTRKTEKQKQTTNNK